MVALIDVTGNFCYIQFALHTSMTVTDLDTHNTLLTPSVRWLIAIGALAVIFLWYFYSSSHSSHRLSDFAGYYTAAKVVVSGDSVPSIYNDEWFKRRVQQLGMEDTSIVFYVNPPPAALIMVPLLWLDPGLAKAIWNILSILLVFIATLLVRRSGGNITPRGEPVIFLALLAISIPFFRNLQRGQIYMVMVIFVLLTWRGYSMRNSWLTGISLGLLLLLKYFGWMFLILFAIEKRWKDIAITTLVFWGGVAISISVLGLDIYRQHIERMFSSFHTLDVASSGLPSIPAFFGAFFVAHPQWNPHPLINVPSLALFLTLLTLVTTLMVTLRTMTNGTARENKSTFLALVILSVLFTPLAADHHYVIFSIPLYMFALLAGQQRLNIARFISCAGLMYLILGWFPAPQIGALPGWSKLVVFVRLYGGILLWLFFVADGSSDPVNKNENP